MSHDGENAHAWDSPCVHCGLCLDTCPTYRLTGVEAESPRGRLYLINAIADGTMTFDRGVIEHLDSCLGCLACESACPSGVQYGRHIEEFRPRIARSRLNTGRRVRALIARAGTHPGLLRSARRLAYAFDFLGLERLRRRIPGLGLIPRHTGVPVAVPVPPPAAPRLRVALLVGCIAHELRPSITSSTINVLRRNGVDVVELPYDVCCGALKMHAGDAGAAADAAARLCRAVESSGAYCLVTSAAGCGAMIRRYGNLFTRAELNLDSAMSISRRVRDVSELLMEIGIRPPRQEHSRKRLVAYHDACHLLHGCGVDRAPREILSTANVRWVDLTENAICCGSAGVYNLLHPRTASQLARRKVELLIASAASDVAIGNIGCIMQLELALAHAGREDIGVWHPIELLDAAYREEGS
jgi:glycolate oxidase iron-sulfur subunit